MLYLFRRSWTLSLQRNVVIAVDQAKTLPESEAVKSSEKGRKYIISFQGDGSGHGQRPNPEDLWKERMKGLVIDVECLPDPDVGEYN